MDALALRDQLNNLEALRSSLHSLFRFWEWMVVLGLVIDLIVIVKEFRDDWQDFRRGEIHAPERPNTLILILGLLGTGLIAFGISRELSIDSRIEGVETQIRGVNEQLFGRISQEAEEASSASATAKSDAKTANEQVDAAKKVSGEAQTKADAATKRADELNNQLATTEKQLEAVEAKRAELAKSLENLAICNAPRVIPFWSIGNTKTSMDPLKPFAGRQAIVEFVPDAEARRAALNVAGSLDRAGWKITRISSMDGIEDGVEIQPFQAPLPEQTNESYSLWQAEIGASEAADVVVDFLHSYNWQARRGWPTDETGKLIRDPKIIPPGSLRIRVGLYPSVAYVSPPGAKDFAETIAQFDQERRKIEQQTDAEEQKREEELFKQLTPQQITEYKARSEEWKKRDKQMKERYSGPCQPLTPLAPSP